MNEKIRNHLVKYAKLKGYSIDDATLIEILLDSRAIGKQDEDEHRWWIEYTQFVEIDGMIIGFAKKFGLVKDPCDYPFILNKNSPVKEVQTDKTTRIPMGATCHYERIDGKWFVVWGADFDPSGRAKVTDKDAILLEMGYQQKRSEISSQTDEQTREEVLTIIKRENTVGNPFIDGQIADSILSLLKGKQQAEIENLKVESEARCELLMRMTSRCEELKAQIEQAKKEAYDVGFETGKEECQRVR